MNMHAGYNLLRSASADHLQVLALRTLTVHLKAFALCSFGNVSETEPDKIIKQK